MGSDALTPSPELRRFATLIDSIFRNEDIEFVEIEGISSIDGSLDLNSRLAMGRAKAMGDFIIATTSVDPASLKVTSLGEDWDLFGVLVDRDSNIPAQAQLSAIIRSADSPQNKEAKIRKLDGGNTWKYLAEFIFPLMRTARVSLGEKHKFVLVAQQENLPEPEPEPEPEPPVVEEIKAPEVEVVEEEVAEVVEEPEPTPMPAPEEPWRRRFYIKTDLPLWLITWSNLIFEVDLVRHWSFNLPVNFSAMNYFKHTIKFRVFGFQPGVRYWVRPDNNGVYLEAHYGMGWYNFAFGGRYRYQDHFRDTPSLGGGIAAGYRLPVSKNGRWHMEFGAGVGVYRLHYDKFINDYNGKLVGNEKKTWFGIDNLNVSISYSFPIDKKAKATVKGGSL